VKDIYDLSPIYESEWAQWIFLVVKDGVRGGRRFRCDEDIKNAVHEWLRAQPKTFYYDGIKQLVGR
jgi:hypothetical protein